jgi:hypothetical protein
MYLGLDISTTFTGFTILDITGSVIANEAIDLRNKKYTSILLKAQEVERRLSLLKQAYKIEKVFIEQSLQAFRPGLSSASVILTLGKFNGIVSWLIYKIFGFEPEYISVQTARKSLNITVPRGENAKKLVLERVLELEPDFKVEYTAHGNPIPGTFDRADSYVIVKAGYLSCLRQKS